MPNHRQLMTARDVAERLALPLDRVYRFSQAGLLPRVQIGRVVRFDPEAIDEFIANGGRRQLTADHEPDAAA